MGGTHHAPILYPDPDLLDITRKPSDHLARLEVSRLLERLADRVARFEIMSATR